MCTINFTFRPGACVGIPLTFMSIMCVLRRGTRSLRRTAAEQCIHRARPLSHHTPIILRRWTVTIACPFSIISFFFSPSYPALPPTDPVRRHIDSRHGRTNPIVGPTDIQFATYRIYCSRTRTYV